jgi:hypothetical protein
MFSRYLDSSHYLQITSSSVSLEIQEGYDLLFTGLRKHCRRDPGDGQDKFRTQSANAATLPHCRSSGHETSGKETG